MVGGEAVDTVYRARPIGAGIEKSVAATKTVALSMIAGMQLVAALAHDGALNESLQQLPRRLSQALTCDWSVWADTAAHAPAAFIVGRGYGLGCVREHDGELASAHARLEPHDS